MNMYKQITFLFVSCRQEYVIICHVLWCCFFAGWILRHICLPGIAKAWRLALDPELKYAIENVDHLMKGMKRAGQMPAEGGDHALRTLAEKIFQACMSKETEQISLDCLDPKTPAMLEKFKDQCEERFGSLQDAFEKVDVDGVGIVSREDFRILCHEVKVTDGIFRLFEFLDPKRTGEIRLSLIDGEVTEDAMLATQTRRQMQNKQASSESWLLQSVVNGSKIGLLLNIQIWHVFPYT